MCIGNHGVDLVLKEWFNLSEYKPAGLNYLREL